MADIQIPNRAPIVPQFQGAPADMINMLYNRPKPAEVLADTLQGIANDRLQKRAQQQQLLLAAQQKKIDATKILGDVFHYGGPDAVNQFGQGAAQIAGADLSQYQSPQTTTGQAPTQQTGSSIIDSSINNLGHPDIAGLYAKYSNMGEYGANKIKLAAIPITIQQKQQELEQNAPYTQGQSSVINNPNATPQQFAAAFPAGVPKTAQTSFQTARALQNQQNEFDTTKRQQLDLQQKQIEKEFQDKNSTLINAADAINQALQLKQQSGTTGPLNGAFKSIVGSATSGAVDNAAYQLNKSNELQRSALQHAQQVNRFNPDEVGFIGGGALAQPGEPLNTSTEKAQNALNAYKKQYLRNLAAKNAQLASLGLPPSQPDDNLMTSFKTLSAGSPNQNGGNGYQTTAPTGYVPQPGPNHVTQPNPTTVQRSGEITSQAEYDALPNGASYTFNGQPHIKGRS